jgi:hypothetical protein
MSRMRSSRQKRQQELSWALRIITGTIASIQSSVPRDISHRNYTLAHLRMMERNIRENLRNIP